MKISRISPPLASHLFRESRQMTTFLLAFPSLGTAASSKSSWNSNSGEERLPRPKDSIVLSWRDPRLHHRNTLTDCLFVVATTFSLLLLLLLLLRKKRSVDAREWMPGFERIISIREGREKHADRAGRRTAGTDGSYYFHYVVITKQRRLEANRGAGWPGRRKRDGRWSWTNWKKTI